MNSKLTFFYCAALLGLASLSACTVPAPTSENPKATAWSGSVPPFYCRWNSEMDGRQNFIFPLVYFNDAGTRFYSLFGWDYRDSNVSTLTYFLTPMLSYHNRRAEGIRQYNGFILNWRTYDPQKQPDANFDMDFFPLLNYKSPTSVNGTYSRKINVGSDLCVYHDEEVVTQVKDAQIPMDATYVKNGYAGIYSKSIANTRYPTIGRIYQTQHRNILPFYWDRSFTLMNQVPTPELFSVYSEKESYIFPLCYEAIHKGTRPNDRTLKSETIDRYDFLVFPFYHYKREAKDTRNMALLMLYVHRYYEKSDIDMFNFLWLFGYGTSPTDDEFSFLGDFFRFQVGENPEFHGLFFLHFGEKKAQP